MERSKGAATKRLVGTRIKSLREKCGLTQEQLAEKVDINTVYLSKIERGLANPTFDTFIRLSDALDVNIWEVFRYQKEENSANFLKAVFSFVESAEYKSMMADGIKKRIK